MGNYVEIVNPYIDYSGGKVSLNDLVDLEVNDSQDSRPVHTMNRRRVARGFRDGPVTASGSMSIAMAVVPEVDWNALMKSREEFTLGYERGDGGLRYQIVQMKITAITEKHSQEGEPGWNVTWVAAEVRKALS